MESLPSFHFAHVLEFQWPWHLKIAVNPEPPWLGGHT